MSFSTYSSLSERKNNQQKPSRVLLVCVYQTIIFELTNSVIFQKFSPFGGITKILIFQKGEVTKFFIEFNEIQSALNAKTTLDGLKFYENICKMNIYYSNFNNVDLKHQSTQGADYEGIQDRQSQFVQNFDHLAQSLEEQNTDFLDDYSLMQTFSPFVHANQFSRSKTENPKSLETQIMKMQIAQKRQASRFNSIEEQQVDKSIKYQMNSLLSEGQVKRQSVSQKKLPPHHDQLLPKKNLSVCNLKLQNPNQNANSILSYFMEEWIPLRQVYNLFSNFGNIQCIVAKKTHVYIKFRSGYFAAVAMNYLSGTHFLGNTLNLAHTQNQQEYLPKAYEYSQSIYFDQSSDRFTPKRSITVNPPSDTLHVSSIKKENCNENSLRKIFGPYGYVDRVKILMQSNEKNMALVKFSSMRDSFYAISELHNKTFGGRKMQISFTKSKL